MRRRTWCCLKEICLNQDVSIVGKFQVLKLKLLKKGIEELENCGTTSASNLILRHKNNQQLGFLRTGCKLWFYYQTSYLHRHLHRRLFSWKFIFNLWNRPRLCAIQLRANDDPSNVLSSLKLFSKDCFLFSFIGASKTLSALLDGYLKQKFW